MNADDQDREVKNECENIKAACEQHLSSSLFAQDAAATDTMMPACKTVDDEKIFKVETIATKKFSTQDFVNDVSELKGYADNYWKETYKISEFLRLLKDKLAASDGTEESKKRKDDFVEELQKQRNAVDNKD